MSGGDINRRQVLAGATGAAGLLVAGCGDNGGGDGGAGSGSSSSGGGATASGPIVALDKVPVGGAVSAKNGDSPIIVSQPEAGTVVAFSAICTHMGCTVAPSGAQLKCPCHGSVYQAKDGSNVSGPAPRPLAKVEVKVVDGQVVSA